MPGLFQGLRRRRALRKSFMALLTEIEDNLEAYYVMFQINRLRYFSLETFGAVRAAGDTPLPPEVERYAALLEEYNGALRHFKEYETWYAADPDRKTPDNSRALHERQVKAKERFTAQLEETIKSARDALAAVMRREGFLKDDQTIAG